jgi:hypothetical protein
MGARIVTERYHKLKGSKFCTKCNGENQRNFENQISPVNQIKTDSYNHAHELIRQEIKRWLETTENSREYSLNLILNK